MVFHHFQDVAYTGFMFILGNLRGFFFLFMFLFSIDNLICYHYNYYNVTFFHILVEMIRVPDWAFEAAGQETRSMAQDAAYHLGLYLTPAQVI